MPLYNFKGKIMKSTVTPQQVFNHVASPQIQRSTFDRSHGYKTTFNEGKLIPIFLDEALPGDTFNLHATLFGRIATPIKPIMDNIYLDTHFFSVPLRLIWDNWKRFNGEQTNPGDSTNYIMPTITTPAGGATEQTIYDYMGIPTKIAGITFRADFNRAINLIYNEWFRDENLQTSVYCPHDDGPDTYANYTLLPRGKRKDYFTGALPFAQKGTAVSIPLGTTAPIKSDGNASYMHSSTTDRYITMVSGDSNMKWDTAPGLTAAPRWGTNADPTKTGLIADLSTATASTINQLREAFQIQRMYEKDARGGTRYTELLRSHFGVTSPDARQQRPEYLGGSTSPININAVTQTAPTAAGTTPQGNLAAMGTVASSGHGFVKSFTEHEIIVGFVSVRADLNYQQGLNRMWSRSTRFDFFWPSLAHLGEQGILNKEIYAQGTAGGAADNTVFGYQERYAEYRFKPSQVTGLYRSNATGTLDIWHLSQNFAALPALNAAFIVEQPPISRVVAIPTEPHFLLDCYFNLKTARPMPTFATPGLIDHF